MMDQEQVSPFADWLEANHGSDHGPLGEVASRSRYDEEFPRQAEEWATIEQHLRSIGCSDPQVEVTRQAWQEYRCEVEELAG